MSMPIPKKVTRRLLKKLGACSGDVDLFDHYWPKGVELTPQVMTLAKRRGLQTYWFAVQIVRRASRAARERYYAKWSITPESWLRAELKLRAEKPKKRAKRK